jgi:uncharacterized protein
MQLLPITALYSGLLAILLFMLSVNIIRLRYKYRVGIGDGGEQELSKAVRIHGNFVEYIPLALVLMAVFELNQGASVWLHSSGALLVLGRISHAIGLTKTIGPSIYRQFGMVSLFLVLLALASANIVGYFS